MSADTPTVITGTPPVDILAQEKHDIHSHGWFERAERKWQTRWNDTTEEAQYTKRLIPRLEQWLNCKFRRTDYYTTKFLTGHG